MQLLIIVNSKHKLDSKVVELIDGLRNDSDLNCILKVTKRKKHAKKLSAKHAGEKDVVIAVGGDGTFHEVVNGLCKEGHHCALGLVANGTGNDLVRMFRPLDTQRFIDRVKTAEFTNVDLGFLADGESERYFINISGLGLDGRVIELVEASAARGKESRLSYARAIIHAFLSYKKPILRLTGDDFCYEGPVMMVTMCNGRVFGDGLVIAPQASLTDGKLNVTILGKIKLIDYLINLGKLKKGTIIRHKQVFYHETTKLKVELLSGTITGESDGEVLSMTNLEAQLLPNRLKLVNELLD